MGSTKQNRTHERSTAAPASCGDDMFLLSDDEFDKALIEEAVAEVRF